MRVDSLDQYETPLKLAVEIARSAGPFKNTQGPNVADFAAGTGQLLRAVQEMWPQSEIVATDINPDSIANIKRRHPSWSVDVCNFLDPIERRTSEILEEYCDQLDLVVLNPPFSSRGGTKFKAEAHGLESTCSQGLAFLINSINYLRVGGQLIAVLPSGSKTSEKDALAWNLLDSLGCVEVLSRGRDKEFERINVRTDIIRFTLGDPEVRSVSEELKTKPQIDFENGTVKLIRGSIQVHSAIVSKSPGQEKVPFIHSTNLLNGNVQVSSTIRTDARNIIQGPLVLLPRVGLPKITKLALFEKIDSIALSDCVIALKTRVSSNTHQLWIDLTKNWPILEPQYCGSAAPYITIKRLARMLEKIGYRPEFLGRNFDYVWNENHE